MKYNFSIIDYDGAYVCVVQTDVESSMWQQYLEYVDEIVVDGLRSSVSCSLQYLLTNTEKGAGKGPLLECKMELQAPVIIFLPDLDQVRTFFLFTYELDIIGFVNTFSHGI